VAGGGYIPIALGVHGGTFLLAWTGQPVWWVWLLGGLHTVLAGGLVYRYYYLQYAALTVPEKRTLSLAIGILLFLPALLGVTSPWSPLAPTRDLLPVYYPPLALLLGLWLYVHGITQQGVYFVVGLAHVPLAFVLRLVPDWSPLLFGGFVAAIWAWMAVDWRPPAPDRLPPGADS
jgi:hypothetical protein